MILKALSLLAANFIFIGLKSFQQRNVAFMNYKLVFPTSALMGLTEIYIIGVIASGVVNSTLSPLDICAIITGGGLGCIASMYIHHKYVPHNKG